MLLGPTLWCSGLGCSRKVCLFTRFPCETGATTGLGTRVFQNKKLMGGGVGWGEEVEEQQKQPVAVVWLVFFLGGLVCQDCRGTKRA